MFRIDKAKGGHRLDISELGWLEFIVLFYLTTLILVKQRRALETELCKETLINESEFG